MVFQISKKLLIFIINMRLNKVYILLFLLITSQNLISQVNTIKDSLPESEIDNIGLLLSRKFKNMVLDDYLLKRNQIFNFESGYLFICQFTITESGKVSNLIITEFPKFQNADSTKNQGRFEILPDETLYDTIKLFISDFLKNAKINGAYTNVNYILPVFVNQERGFGYENNFLEVLKLFFNGEKKLIKMLKPAKMDSSNFLKV